MSRRTSLYLSTQLTRRSLLKAGGLGAAALCVPGCATQAVKKAAQDALDGATIESISPIDRTLSSARQSAFSGDQPDRSHRILWDKAGYLASHGNRMPTPAERVPLAIVGGGISGLMSAYLLKHHRPVLLERAERMGGNARGESWDGLDYSIGAAYFMEPEQGSHLSRLLTEIGARQLYRVKAADDPVVMGQKRYYHFWDGETAPDSPEQFLKLKRYFHEIATEKNGRVFPDIPITDSSKRRGIEALDRQTFKQHLERIAGGKLHRHIETALEHFCWSSFGGPFQDVSAAAGLNFYAGEFSNLCVAPGGNAAIAERVLSRLLTSLPRSHLRTDSVVFDVAVVSDGVVITYEDRSGQLKSIHARACILACPKFVVARILRDAEPARLESIRKLRYHSYLVGNVLLKKPIPDDFYDLYLIGQGNVDPSNIAASAEAQKVTDVVHGTYAKLDSTRSILTLYRGMPYLGGRGQLYADGAYSKYRGEFERQILDSILPLVGCSPRDVSDIRVTRWGHPLPMAQAGLIADGTIDAIRKPFRERVFFVEQDNWMLPAFETAAGEAITWAPQIDQLLGASIYA